MLLPLHAEIDADGNLLPGRSLDHCEPLTGDYDRLEPDKLR